MTVISVKHDEQVFILNEDNEFVCAHTEQYVENPRHPEDAVWICEQCDMYAAAFIGGISEEGYPEYRKPDMWEWQ